MADVSIQDIDFRSTQGNCSLHGGFLTLPDGKRLDLQALQTQYTRRGASHTLLSTAAGNRLAYELALNNHGSAISIDIAPTLARTSLQEPDLRLTLGVEVAHDGRPAVYIYANPEDAPVAVSAYPDGRGNVAVRPGEQMVMLDREWMPGDEIPLPEVVELDEFPPEIPRG